MEDFHQEIKDRHSVRQYLDTPLTESQIQELSLFIQDINQRYGMDFALHVNEDVFSHWILGYGFIKNCNNYLSFAGPDSPELDEKVGYYGELVVLKAQQLGLNTCWVGGTYRDKAVRVNPSSRLVCVIALGVGKTNGKPSSSKRVEAYYQGEDVPSWFLAGMEAVRLAPSAINQKKWVFTYLGEGKVEAINKGRHFNEVDLGIAKLHFELGSGHKVFSFPLEGFPNQIPE